MKKIIFCCFALTMLMLCQGVSAQDISVIVNGENVDFGLYDNALPYIENNSVMIPIRAIAEALGADVGWESSDKTVTIDGTVNVSFVIGSSEAVVDGETTELEASAVIAAGRTYVPLRFAAEALGADVDWDEENYAVTITSAKEESTVTEGSWDHNGGPGMAMSRTTDSQAALINEASPKFSQYTFTDEETGETQEYSLFIPKDYDETQKYPLVMFIPDMTSIGKSVTEEIETYYGANIWASDSEQEKHPSFVLVPCYTERIVDDEWNTSDQIETTVKLINSLTEQYSIDTDRLYTTGQSMGCMTSIYLNSKYPDLFAASMLVSGHWDLEVLRTLNDRKFFYIVSMGDGNCAPCQTSLKELFDEDGVEYSSGTWSAQLSAEEQNANVSELLSAGNNINMIAFELGTTLTEDDEEGASEHMTSFNYGYELTAVRDWLFEQTK